jgi:hypothetical protein
VPVAGEVTTYTLDYGRGMQLLVEQGGAFAETKRYLYGLQCIGELVDAGNPEIEEWRYYQRDAQPLVRQTTDSAGKVSLAWSYTPEGSVLMGEEGPVTNLECGAVYDWSTGLNYKGGRYFDPVTGVWLSLTPFVIWQAWKPAQRGRGGKRAKERRRLLLLALLLVVALGGCDGDGTPHPDQRRHHAPKQ